MIYIYFHYSWRLIIASKLHTHNSKTTYTLETSKSHHPNVAAQPAMSVSLRERICLARARRKLLQIALTRSAVNTPTGTPREKERETESPPPITAGVGASARIVNGEWARERGDVSDGLPRFMGILSARLSRVYAVPREPRLVVWRNDVHYKVDAAARRAYSGFC